MEPTLHFRRAPVAIHIRKNASHEYSQAQVKEMITHQQEKYSWNFLFLGANMSAVKEAENLGIDADFARTYMANQTGTARLYAGVSETMAYIIPRVRFMYASI